MEPKLDSPDAQRYLALLEGALPDKKVRHCVSVTELMLFFGDDIALDRQGVLMAGLLHDIARKESGATLLKHARRYGIPVTAVEEARPKLLHGPVAAEQCRRELDIARTDVYEAIYWHTTARPGLGRLGQALYFADFAEPLREYSEAARARALLAEQGFDDALLYVARMKLAFLQAKKVVAPASKQFLAWLEQERSPCRD